MVQLLLHVKFMCFLCLPCPTGLPRSKSQHVIDLTHQMRVWWKVKFTDSIKICLKLPQKSNMQRSACYHAPIDTTIIVNICYLATPSTAEADGNDISFVENWRCFWTDDEIFHFYTMSRGDWKMRMWTSWWNWSRGGSKRKVSLVLAQISL